MWRTAGRLFAYILAEWFWLFFLQSVWAILQPIYWCKTNKEIVNDIQNVEKMTFLINLRVVKFLNYKGKWTTFETPCEDCMLIRNWHVTLPEQCLYEGTDDHLLVLLCFDVSFLFSIKINYISARNYSTPLCYHSINLTCNLLTQPLQSQAPNHLFYSHITPPGSWQ